MQHQHHRAELCGHRADLGSDVKLFQFFRIRHVHVHVCSLDWYVCDWHRVAISLSLSHNTAGQRRIINTVTQGNFHWVICTGKLSLIFFRQKLRALVQKMTKVMRSYFCRWDADRNTAGRPISCLGSDPGLWVRAVNRVGRYLGGYLVSHQQTGILTEQQERSNRTHGQHRWRHHGETTTATYVAVKSVSWFPLLLSRLSSRVFGDVKASCKAFLHN